MMAESGGVVVSLVAPVHGSLGPGPCRTAQV